MLEMMLATGKPPAPTGKVVKLLAAQSRILALHEDGTLYARGADSAAGILGNNGVSSIGKWFALLTNVQDFWISPTFILMYTKDNRWFYNGRYLNGTTTVAAVPTEITTLFSAMTAPYAKVSAGSFGIAVLDTSNNLYTMGYNQNGWLFNGTTSTHQTTLTLRTETNVKDVELLIQTATMYIHYQDLSVKGAGASPAYQLTNTTASNTSLVPISTASQAASKIVAGVDVIWFKRSTGWYYLGPNTVGQTGVGTTAGNSGSAQQLVTGAAAGEKLICMGYRTWVSANSVWRFTGSNPIGCGTNTVSTVPWNSSTMTDFANIPVASYPILADPIPPIDGGTFSYFLYKGVMYGCGNATTNKMLPGFGVQGNILGYRELNNDFAFVE